MMNSRQVIPSINDWKPQESFLADLKEWQSKHQNDKLPGILKNVKTTLESDQFKAITGLTALIPSHVAIKPLVDVLVILIQSGIVSRSSFQLELILFWIVEICSCKAKCM